MSLLTIFRKKRSRIPNQYKDIEIGNLVFGHSRGDFHLDREELQETIWNFFEKNDFDNYGHYYKNPDEHYNAADNSSYKNETFVIRPYYWGEDETIARLPNFEHYPTGLQISWYKYALRDAYSNQDITKEQLEEVLLDCERSMNE